MSGPEIARPVDLCDDCREGGGAVRLYPYTRIIGDYPGGEYAVQLSSGCRHAIDEHDAAVYGAGQ